MVDRQLKMSGDPGDQNVHRPDRVACPETLDLFSPKAPPHQAHSKTSRDAAIKIAGKAGTLRRLVYDSLVIHGAATDRELQARLDMEGRTERPRRVRVVVMGLVWDSGLKRSHKGRASTVWTAR